MNSHLASQEISAKPEQLHSLRALPVRIGLTLIALGLWWWGVRNWPQGNGAEGYGAGFPAWVASFAVLLAAWIPALRRPRLRWTAGRTLILIVVVAAALIRFYRVTEVPFGIHFDENTGFESLQAMDRGLAENIFSMARTETGPGLTLGTEWVVGLFTPNRFVANRYTAALWGTLSILVTYLLGSRLRSPTVGLVAAVFLTCSYWHLISSRFQAQFLAAPCAAGLICWSIVRVCDSGRPFDAIFAGVIAGLGLQLYHPIKIMFVAVPLWWLWHALVTRQFARRTILPVAVTAIVAWMVLQPLIQREGFRTYFERASAVTVLGADFRHRAMRQQTSTFGFLRTQLARQLRLITGGAEVAADELSDDPMLNWLEVAAVVIGLAVSVRRWRSWRETVAPILLVVTMGAVALSSVPEASYRLAVALPVLAILAGIGITTLLDWYRRHLSRRLGITVIVVGIVLLAYDVQINARRTMHYFARRAAAQDIDTLDRGIAAGNKDAVYYIEAPPARLTHRVVLALTHRRTIVAVPNLTDYVPRSVDPHRPAVFVIPYVTSEYSLPYLRGLYPNAVVRPLANPTGAVAGYFAEVSSNAVAAAMRGIKEASCGLRRVEGQHQPGRVDPFLAFLDIRALLADAGIPELEWRGRLEVPDPPPAEIGVTQTSMSSSMTLDGVPVLTSSAGRTVLPFAPAPGGHAIGIRLKPAGTDPPGFWLWWRLPGQQEVVIPCSRLTPEG